jgi:serine/threonine-protein kinase RsbW
MTIGLASIRSDRHYRAVLRGGWSAMREVTAATPTLAWSRAFPATPDQAGEARRFLAGLLAGHPATDDAVACLSELVANAIRHSRSARPDGEFSVRMRRSRAAIRVEVTDQGGPWGCPPHGPEHGRGLHIVSALSNRRGITLSGATSDPRTRTVWYEIDPP